MSSSLKCNKCVSIRFLHIFIGILERSEASNKHFKNHAVHDGIVVAVLVDDDYDEEGGVMNN